jgi:oligopeptide/dipeptide ABC transporter ATP-binding protein
MAAGPLLRVTGLETRLTGVSGSPAVVDGVDLEIGRGEAVGLVGESGCGKTMLALSLLRLAPQARIRGSVALEGRELLGLAEGEMRAVRGAEIAMIFQDPATSFNPVLTVGEQIAEVSRLHRSARRAEAWRDAVEALRSVGIAAPEERARSYPHQLSGGMRQRAMLAMALAGDPALLIADEPTTALDATVAAQMLALLRETRERAGMALLFISHDLGAVAAVCERVYVMYAGQIVEQAPVRQLFEAPAHPYAAALIGCRPSSAAVCPGLPRRRLETISGAVPAPGEWEGGCRFASRCPRREERCAQEEVPLTALGQGRQVRCVSPMLEQGRGAGERSA